MDKYNEFLSSQEEVKDIQPTDSLVEWKNPPTVAKLKADFEGAKGPQASQMSKIREWLDDLNIEGAAKIKPQAGRSQIQPKLIRKQAEWRYAPLSEPFLSASDLFRVSPVSWEDRKAAQQNEIVLNNQFQNKINKVKFIDEYVRSLVNEGTVICRTGWKVETETVEEEEHTFAFYPLEDEESLNQLMEWADMKENEPDSFSQLPPEVRAAVDFSMENDMPVRAIIESTEMVEVEKVIVNEPTVEVCPTKNIYVDPTCDGDLDKANFVIFAYTTSLAELKANKNYKNLENLERTDTSFANSPDDAAVTQESRNFTFADKPRQKISVYEYWGFWDIEGDGILKPIVATWANNEMIRLEENPYPDGKVPFVVVPYLPVAGSIYGETDSALLADNQKVIGAIMRGIIDLMGKSASSQTGIGKGMLDVVNRRRFESGQDYEFNPNTDPRSHVFQHTYPEVPNSALNVLTMMNTDAEALTGVRSFSTGGGITGAGLGDTAASVRGALDAASKRELAILRRLSQGIIQIGRKFIAMNALFLDEEEIVRVTNEKFIPVRRDDLPGNFDLTLTISTAEADNEKAQELAFMLQTMGNNLDPSMSKIILSEIARLRKMPDLAHTIENFEPQPDPMQEMIQQLEIQKLQAEIELIQAQASEAGSKGILNQNKVPVEQARAASLQGDADRKSLDYVEQHDGIQHQRDLELEQQRGVNQFDLQEQNNATKMMQQGNDLNYQMWKTAMEARLKSAATSNPNKL